MSAVEDQQEQDQQEQQFHHSQIYTKCVDRKTVLYAVWKLQMLICLTKYYDICIKSIISLN